MNLSKREFLQVLGAASVAGMGLGRWAEADAATAQQGLYDLKPFGNVSFLHMTDCHAQLKPLYFREPSVNIGVGAMRGEWPPWSSLMVASPSAIAMPSAESHVMLRSSRGTP